MYKYIDQENIYTYKNGILKNLYEIQELEDLIFLESALVAKRLSELYEKPIKINKANDLQKIHKYLFQDIYTWAGELRQVNISKSGKQFLPLQSF